MAVCDLELVLYAARSAYRVGPNKFIYDEQARGYKLAETVNPSKKEDYQETLNLIKDKGYSISKDISPEGGGNTNLAGAVLVPDDDKSPIVIAYRGTSTSKDLWADFRLGLMGVVGRNFRQQAYDLYLQVKKDYPDKEILLTGHSLGGHLAQYVGAKAYAQDLELRKTQSLYVRTFNTAPISTTHKSLLNNTRRAFNNFINYRLANDVVSDLPIQEYYGNVFDIQYDKSFCNSHGLSAIIQALPDDIKKQHVGASDSQSAYNNMILESIRGVFESYRCSFHSQWFPGLSQFINVKLLNRFEKLITSSLEEANYFQAKFALGKLNKLVRGERTKQLVGFMFDSVCKAEAKDPSAYSFDKYTARIREITDELNNLSKLLEGEEYNTQARYLLEQMKICDQYYIKSQGFNLQGQVLLSSQIQGEQGALANRAISAMRNTNQCTSGVLLDPQSRLRVVVSPSPEAKQTAEMVIPKDAKADLSVEKSLKQASPPPSLRTPLRYLLNKLSSNFYAAARSLEKGKKRKATQALIEDCLSTNKDTWLFSDGKSLKSFFKNRFKNKASFEDGETRRLYQAEGVNGSCYYIPPYHLVIDQNSGKWRASFTPSSHRFVRTNSRQKTIPEVQSTTKILLSPSMSCGQNEQSVPMIETPSVDLWSRQEKNKSKEETNPENSEDINLKL